MNRKIEFDIMKGIGILLVILGHSHIFWSTCTLPDILYRTIESFHVPLFYIVARYFSRTFDNSWKTNISNYFNRLYVPFIITAIVIITYNALIAYKRHSIDLLTGILGTFLFAEPTETISSALNFPHDMGVGPVWFLLALFWAKSLFLLISRSEKYTYLICFLLSWGFSYLEVPMPFMIRQGITALGFVALGHWWRYHSIPWWVIVLSIACWMVEIILQVRISPYSAHYTMYPLNLIGAFGATYIIYLCSICICKIKYISRALASIGNNSMNILCAHTIDMRCNAIRLVIKKLPISPWLLLTIEYLITIALSYTPLIIDYYKSVHKE